MALIECKECGNQISDTAASCPKCGATVPRTIGPDEEQCPHCMTVVKSTATTCPNCRAKKGYIYSGRDGVFGKVGTILWGIVVPLALIVVFPYIAIISIPLALWSIFALVRGPRWYASRHAT